MSESRSTSESTRQSGAAFAVGQRLIAEEPLLRVELDIAAGALSIATAGSVLVARSIVATNLLGPWDGAPGVVERADLVAFEAGAWCVELRIRFVTVPRHYRLVARSIELHRVA